MPSKNICKFVSTSPRTALETMNFIYETDDSCMSQNIFFTSHRMILIVQGKGIISFNNDKIPLSAGCLVFGFVGELFKVETTEPTEYMYISFNGSKAEEFFLRFNISPINRVFPGFESLIPMWKNTLSRTAESNMDLATEGILLYTLSRFDAGNTTKNAVIQQMLSITEDNFTDSEFSIATIAEELEYSPKYLSRLFKSKQGINYSEYLRNMRISYAVTLFDHGIDSVKSIALLSGFRDPLYFSSVFKKTVGVAPTEYKSGKNESQKA